MLLSEPKLTGQSRCNHQRLDYQFQSQQNVNGDYYGVVPKTVFFWRADPISARPPPPTTSGAQRARPSHGLTPSTMKNHVAAALLGLCLTAGGASASDDVASMSARSSSDKEAFASHQHSPAFLGFMSKHGKKYCDGDHACEVSILREQIWNLNQEFVNAHNSNPGACSAIRPRRSKRAIETLETQHPLRGFRHAPRGGRRQKASRDGRDDRSSDPPRPPSARNP